VWGSRRSGSTVENDKNEIRQYLLGQLAEVDQERVELRLMSDPVFTEEFDIVVDEMAALYIGDQFQGEEKDKVEQYFLRSPARQQKVKFMNELLRQIAAAPAQEPVNDAPAVLIAPELGLVERLLRWWRNQSPSMRAATAFATVVVIFGTVFFLRPMRAPTYASLELAMTSAERGAGAEIPKVNLSGKDELRLKLKLPDDAPPASSYRAQLRGEGVSRQLSTQQQDSQSLRVVVAASELTRGSYAIELTAVAANGTEVPLRGAYMFAVE
jgi:hypothetical protein